MKASSNWLPSARCIIRSRRWRNRRKRGTGASEDPEELLEVDVASPSTLRIECSRMVVYHLIKYIYCVIHIPKLET